MISHLDPIAEWMARTLLAGGGLLLIALALSSVVRQPVRRRMIASIAVRVALLVPLLAVGPQWLRLTLPAEAPPGAAVDPAPEIVSNAIVSITPQPPAASSDPASTRELIDWMIVPTVEAPVISGATSAPNLVAPVSGTEFAPEIAPERHIPWRGIVAGFYMILAAAFALRWAFGLIGVWWMMRCSRPVGESLRRLFERASADWLVRPDLRVASRLSAPVCGGLRRPVVLLPQHLAESGDEETLRWVFAHELAHLRQGDAWTMLWFGLAAALYFPLPWFWRLRRRAELDQEFVADAEAAARSRPEDYAAFLVELSRSARSKRRPAGFSGVLGTPSELYRRIAMLLNDSTRVDRVCPRRWSLLATGAFLSMAVLLTGLGLTRELVASPADTVKADGKDDQKKDAPKADEPKKGEDEKFVKPRPRVREFPFAPGGNFNPEELDKYLRNMMEEMQKRMQQGGFGGGGAFFPPQGPFGGGAMVGPRKFMPFDPFGRVPGRLGAMVEVPHAALVEQLDLPKDQGLVLTEIQADSAAAKAGLKANDILLEINGKAVPSDPQEFRNKLAEIKADTPVDAVVLRKGKRETIKGVKLPEAKAEFGPFGGGVPVPNVAGVPAIPAPPIPPIAVQVEGGVPGVHSTQIQISNGNFTIASKDDNLGITVSGKIEDGKTAVSSVNITDGDETVKVDSLGAVPAKYREKVNALLKSITPKNE